MTVDNSIQVHIQTVNIINNDNDAVSPTTTLTHEHLKQHDLQQQQQQQHQYRPASLRPICTALPLYHQQQQQSNHDDDTPTTATVDNNNTLIALSTVQEIDLSEPGITHTLYSPIKNGDHAFSFDKHTSFPSHNPFADPTSSEHNSDTVNSTTHQDPSDLSQQQQDEHGHASQSDGRHPFHQNRKWFSLYTRYFRFNTPMTHSSHIVHSAWISTGALFLIRFVLFVYAASVLLADIILTDRPRYEFCYLTQLSYLGLISYLGTVSWHTLSEWRRERGVRAIRRNMISSGESDSAATAEMVLTRKTTIERQHWFLTDMIFFLYHTICTFHVIVPLLYWGYLSVSGEAHMMAVEISTDSLWRNYSFHGGDLILVLIEFSINAMPFIYSYIVVVFFICLLYLAEAHLVHYVDGFWLYPFLDTSVGPVWVGMYVGVGFVIACAFTVMYFLHRGRNWFIARKIADAAAMTASTETLNDTSVPEMVIIASSVPIASQIGYQSAGAPSASTIMTYTHTSTPVLSTAIPSTAIPSTATTTAPTKTASSTNASSFFRSLAIPTQILIQNRRRSYSNSSNDSTASTLVGNDEVMLNKKDEEFEKDNAPVSERTARRLSMTLPIQNQQQQQQQQNQQQQRQEDGAVLEKVDEELDGEETDHE
ncbi:hypothetical protein FBU30_005416 [Linnemannia zychae]|nr:hypothetical protein FBU30_005416 [Linnemannia zychae]